jgi:hypothetical protein
MAEAVAAGARLVSSAEVAVKRVPELMPIWRAAQA